MVRYNALQALEVPWPAAAGPPGPGEHDFLFNYHQLLWILMHRRALNSYFNMELQRHHKGHNLSN